MHRRRDRDRTEKLRVLQWFDHTRLLIAPVVRMLLADDARFPADTASAEESDAYVLSVPVRIDNNNVLSGLNVYHAGEDKTHGRWEFIFRPRSIGRSAVKCRIATAMAVWRRTGRFKPSLVKRETIWIKTKRTIAF